MDRLAGERLTPRLQAAAAEAHDHVSFHLGADELLRPVLAYDLSAWATVDPATLVHTSCVTPGIDRAARRDELLFESEYLRQDVNHYAQLANAPVPAGTLRAATSGDPARSWRYRHLLQPAGVTDELRVACVDEEGRCFTHVALYRRAGRDPFSAREVELAAALGPVLASGVRLTLLHQAVRQSEALDDPPGMLLLSDGEVTATTEPAERWLDRLGDERLHSAVRATAIKAVEAPTSARVAGRNGTWIGLHAGPVKDQEGTVAVIVEQLRPAELADAIIAALGLTARERDVVQHVLAGRSTRQAAHELGISPWTVQDHLKRVFAKAGVASRGELAALLHHDHYQPRVARGLAPAPYGWFLEPPSGPSSPTGPAHGPG